MRALLASTILLLGCQKPQIIPRLAANATGATITVTSPAFTEGGRIPVDNTCDGKELLPELVLSSPPEGTKSLILLVDDPDTTGNFFTHMIAFNVTPDLRKLPSGPDLGPAAGEGARFGLNDYNSARYSGPCPPRGEVHRYRFRVIALDKVLDLPEGAPKAKIDEAMDGHILGEGQLVGQFGH